MEAPVQNEWMSLAEIIEETGLSRATVYQAANNGTLPVKPVRFGKRILVSRAAWDALKSPQPKEAITEEETDVA